MFKEDVLNALLIIPKGKVVTYKDIAIMINKPKAVRAIGNALHRNENVEIFPCYKVVNSQGKLSTNYAFGGLNGQKKLLENEGIEVVNYKVDLGKYRFKYERD